MLNPGRFVCQVAFAIRDRCAMTSQSTTHPLRAVPLTDTVSVALHRTLRIPDDGREYPLPPSLGQFGVHRVEHLRSAPAEWRERGGFVVPIHQREALWLSFSVPYWKPHALKVGIGGIDALTGDPFDAGRLSADPQDYLVCPDQPWLDGINAGDGFIRQFVAARLGDGVTVEAQLSGSESEGGMELALFAPEPGRFPDEPPRLAEVDFAFCECACPPPAAADMGLGAGGRMRQEIYADAYGIDVWEPEPAATVHLRLVDAIDFAQLTGLPVPATPIDASTYTEHGLPWFDLYDPRRRAITGSDRLAGVRSIDELEGATDESVDIHGEQVVGLLNGQVQTP